MPKSKMINTKALIFKVLPFITLELVEKYFRLEIEGVENIPHTGPVIVAANHSGYSGLDSFLLIHEINKHTGRSPRVLAHKFWFQNKMASSLMKNFGFIKASISEGVDHLNKNKSLIIFPEGEEGNFKPTLKAYQLQEFKRGFIRMALECQCSIIPTIVIGAEESQINLKNFRLPNFLNKLLLPLPAPILPLPIKWKIIFLPPIDLPYKSNKANNHDFVKEIAQDLRERMQKVIHKELEKRKGFIF